MKIIKLSDDSYNRLIEILDDDLDILRSFQKLEDDYNRSFKLKSELDDKSNICSIHRPEWINNY